jgi:hypothetical protein
LPLAWVLGPRAVPVFAPLPSGEAGDRPENMPVVTREGRSRARAYLPEWYA